MIHKINYRGVPAFINFDEQWIAGRNWYQHILIHCLLRIDKLIILITKRDDIVKKYITFDEDDSEE